MSGANVDERIVQMQFDNDEFEKDVSKTMGTLDKLKESLSFTNVKDGFEKIQNGILGLNLGPVEEGLLAVQDGFGMMEMIGLQAMSRISNAVLDMGQKLVNAVAIDPIKSGLQEYETQINAVQTIMANTEEAFKDSTEQEHLDKVNQTLDELNAYADKTIYNFTEMTRNIGTFTAAGVSLDESKTAIQGIANMAAVSGSNAQQASTAMYQLSQALAAGSVKLQDWNSVVNAGMGGEVFKKALQESSKAMVIANEKVQALAASGKKAEEISKETGIELSRVSKLMEDGYAMSYDKAIEKHGTFRESLSEGWITSEVLIDTLRNATLNFDVMTEEEQKATKAMLLANGYTEEQIADIGRLGKTADEAATQVKTFSQLIDTTKEALQSGWTQSWEYIIGDFGEAKKLWTDISNYLGDTINKSADARNTILKQWHDDGGRDNIIEGLKLSFGALVSYATVAKNEVFKRFIPEITVKQLNDFSNTILKIGKFLQPSSLQLEAFRARLEQFVKPLDFVKDFITELRSRLGPVGETLKNIGSALAGVLDHAGHFIEFYTTILRNAGVPARLAEIFVKAFTTIGNFIASTITHLRDLFEALIGFAPFMNKRDMWKNFYSEKLTKFLDNVGAKFTALRTYIDGFFTAINDFVRKLTGTDLAKAFSWDSIINGARQFHDFLASIPIKLGNLKANISTFFSGMAESINNFTGLNLHMPTWDEFKKFLGDIVEMIKHWKENFTNALSSVQAFFSYIWEKLLPVRTMFENATQSVRNFFGSFKKDKDNEEGITTLDRISSAMRTIGDILTKVGQTIMSYVQPAWNKLKDAISKFDFNKIFALVTSGALVKAVLNFSKTAKDIKETFSFDGVMDFIDDISDKLKDGVKLIQDVLEPFGDTLAAFQNKLKADMLKNIALAIAILVGSIVVVSLVDPDKLMSSVAVIGALMGELMGGLYGFQKVADKVGTEGFTKLALGLVELSGAVLILGIALKVISTIEDEPLVNALFSVAALMLMMGLLANSLKEVDGKDFSKAMGGLVVLAFAVKLLVGVVKSLSELEWEPLAKGLVGVAGILFALGLFTKFSDASEMGIGAGIGIILLAEGIKILANVAMTFVELKWEEIAKGLVGIAAILGALALATRFGEIDQMGIGSGIGIILFAKAIQMLAEATVPFTKMRWESISKGLLAVIGLLLATTIALKLMPDDMVAAGIGLMLVSFAIKMMLNAMSEIGKGMKWEELARGMIAMAGGIIAMCIGAKMMSDAEAGAGVIANLMSIALNLMVPAMRALGELSWESIAKGLVTIAGVFIILGAAGYLLGPVVGVIQGLSLAFLAFGGALLLAGVGLAAFAIGFEVLHRLAQVFNAFKREVNLEYFTHLIAFLNGLIPMFITVIGTIITSIIKTVASNATLLITSVVQVGLAILQALMQLAPVVIQVAITLLITFLKAIDENIYLLTVLGASIIVKFIDGLALALPALIESGVNLVVSFIEGIANALVENTDRLINAIEKILKSVAYFILSMIQGFVETLPVVGGQISGAIEDIKKDLEKQINEEEGKKIGSGAGHGVKKGIEETEPEVRTSANKLSLAVNEELDNIDTSGVKTAVKDGVVDGIKESEGEAANAAGDIGGTVNNVLEGYDTSGGGMEMVNKIMGGIEGGETDIAKLSESLGGTALGGFTGVDFTGGGGNFVDEINQGISDKKDEVEDAGEDAGEAGNSGFDGAYKLFYGSGGHLAEGGAQGILDNVDLIRDAGSFAGLEGLNAFNEATGVSSPSWKFAQSGMFQMMGGAEGIRKNVGMLIGAAEYAGNETVDAFSESISDLSDMANLDIDDQPSIRPVLDLSNIQNGVGQIDSLFSRRMATSVTVRPTMNSMDISSAVGGLADLTGKGNGDIVSTLKTQIAMTSQLINILKNQKIYLDGKTCVGGMVNEIDKQLGRKQILAGRRGRG